MVRATQWAFTDNFETLDEWLELLFMEDGERVFPSNHMPSEDMLEEYISTIDKRTEDEVRNLIRKFLIYSGNFGFDKSNLASYNLFKNSDREEYRTMYEKISKTEYYRRLSEEEYAWEGMTWILDLLPKYPKKAIDVIDSYMFAHLYNIPDVAIYGLNDAMTIIRAKFIEVKHPREILLNLKPEQFEWLIEELYEKMGYSTTVTAYRKDGGIDVIAESNELGKQEKIIIQCKRYNKKVGVKPIRELYGLVIKNNANKGVVVCCTEFTKGAIDEKSSLELIGYKELNILLNSYLGTYWYYKLDSILISKELKAASQVK